MKGYRQSDFSVRKENGIQIKSAEKKDDRKNNTDTQTPVINFGATRRRDKLFGRVFFEVVVHHENIVTCSGK